MISNVFIYSYAFHFLSNNNKWYYQGVLGEYYYFVIAIHYISATVHVGFFNNFRSLFLLLVCGKVSFYCHIYLF